MAALDVAKKALKKAKRALENEVEEEEQMHNSDGGTVGVCKNCHFPHARDHNKLCQGCWSAIKGIAS